MKPSNQSNADDRAVSPVIGVILMVAITVILAAVIGTFVLGLGDSIGGTSTAGVAVDGDRVTLTNLGTSDYVVVQASNGTQVGNLTAVGNSTNIAGVPRPVQIVSVADGERTVVRSVE